MSFTPVMAKLNFQQKLLQLSSVTWSFRNRSNKLAAQETVPIIINVENNRIA